MTSTARAPRLPIARSIPLLLLLPFLGAGLPLAAQAPAARKPAPTQAAQAAPQQQAPQPAPMPPGLAAALQRVDRGDLAGAIAELETIRRAGAASPQVLTALGALYLKANRAADALAVLEPLADEADANPATLYNAGRAAFAVGRPESGTTYLERAVAAEPVSPAARELGLLYARTGKPADAYRVLAPFAFASPGDAEARIAAALLALHFRRTGEAEALLAALPPKNPRVQLLRGELALRKGDAKTAVTLLKPLAPAGKEIQPGLAADARRLLGEAYLGAGQAAEAIRLLSAQARTDPSAALLLAHAQVRQGDLNAGIATLAPWAARILTAQNPRDPDLVADMALSYGRMLAAAGRHQEAATALQVATRLTPGSAEAWRDYARSLDALGRKDEAARALARAKPAPPPPKGGKG